METLMQPPALAAAAPVSPDMPVMFQPATAWTSARVADCLEGAVFYGLLAIGVLIPFVAAVYALIVF